jgi:rRNA-processing protein CGR1|eukprot:33552_1
MTGDAKPVFTANQAFTGDVATMKRAISKGRNVSGRSWKLRPQKRASSLITKTAQNGKSTSWEKKQKDREARKALLERERELKEERRQAAILKKERRLEQEKRRIENEFRSASRSAQMLGKNADRKMKTMNKKQLRQIKKTRMNTKTGAIEYVGAYAK